MQYGMMHRALVTTNSSPDLPRLLQDCHVGCFSRVLSVMEERSEDFREALSNIARQARSLLQNFSDSDFFRLLLSNYLNWKIYCDDHSSLSLSFNVQPIEQRMLDQRPRESGILSTRTQSSSQTVNVNNTSIRAAILVSSLAARDLVTRLIKRAVHHTILHESLECSM